MKKFRRMKQHASIAGVCSGLAYHFEIQAWIVKALMVVCFFTFGVGVFAYILVALFAPQYEQDPEDYKAICE